LRSNRAKRYIYILAKQGCDFELNSPLLSSSPKKEKKRRKGARSYRLSIIISKMSSRIFINLQSSLFRANEPSVIRFESAPNRRKSARFVAGPRRSKVFQLHRFIVPGHRACLIRIVSTSPDIEARRTPLSNIPCEFA